MLEIAVLGLLNESPMHGYELRKRLASLLGTFRAFSYGSLYPTLRRLAEAGWITEEAPDPSAGAALGRRARRVYRLTAEGKEHFAELLADVGPDAFDEEGFGARLAFFAQTRSDIRLAVLEGRRRRVEEQRDGLRRASAGRRLDRYTQMLQEHGLESVDREVRWLNELIDHERHPGRFPRRPPPPPRRRRPDGSQHRRRPDPRRHRRRRQLRRLARPGRALLPGRRPRPRKVPGLMHVRFGPYHVRDIEFVAAFDVDAKKVGRDLSEAILASENNTIKICDVPPLGVTVQRGHTLDGLGKYYLETIEESDDEPVDVVQALREAGSTS